MPNPLRAMLDELPNDEEDDPLRLLLPPNPLLLRLLELEPRLVLPPDREGELLPEPGVLLKT